MQSKNLKKNLKNNPLSLNKPLIFAHRGCEKWPNSQFEFEGSRFRGIDYIELDVRSTADNILVVSHNRSLKNTVRRVLVDKNTYKDLYKKTGKKLPKLDEVVEELNGRVRFNFDLKQEGMLPQIRKFIKRHRIENKIIIDSCFYKELAELAGDIPKAKYAYSYNYRDKRGLDSFRLIKMAGYFSYFLLYPFWPQLVKFITKQMPFMPGASIYYRVVNPGIVKFFHDRKIPIYVWPVNSKRGMRKMIELGVDGIKTGKPGLLKRILKSDL